MKNLNLLILLMLTSIGVQAQESLFNAQKISSPEINENHSVVFRYFAPDADQVKISGDFLASDMDMTKDEKGIWSYKSETLAPELYSYSFKVDGLKVNDANNPFYIRDVASSLNIFLIDSGHAELYKVNDIAHGTVSRRWYDSPGLKMDRRITIYTPPGYETSKKKFPVLYLLHGAGGDEEAWISLGRTAQIMDNLIAEGKVVPMIVVMPNGNIIQDAAPGEGSKGFYKPEFMIPGTMNGTYEANFKDIINFVESSYRVKSNKESRAVAGLSMGGFHSLHISRYYPNTFDYVGLFSAAIMPREDKSGSNVYSDLDATLKRQKDNGLKLYWIAIGKDDFLYKNNVEFRQKLDSIGFKYSYKESEGGHIWRNWRNYLSEFTPMLFK